jgi:hypothetical protein
LGLRRLPSERRLGSRPNARDDASRFPEDRDSSQRRELPPTARPTTRCSDHPGILRELADV